MDIKRASEVAEQLQSAFRRVFVQGAREPIFVTGREHTRFKHTTLAECQHVRVRRSKGVTAGMKRYRGRIHLTKANDDHPLIHFESVETCLDCDAVVHYEFKKEDD